MTMRFLKRRSKLVEDIEAAIIELVALGPLKAPDLAVGVVQTLHERNINTDYAAPLIVDTMDNMVSEGKIVEVEYVLPSMPYRSKSLYFPALTELIVRRNPSGI